MKLVKLQPMPPDEEREARDADARARFEADRDEDADSWHLVPRPLRKRGAGVTFTFSVRLEAAEIDELRRAGEARGMNASEFIRAAALTVARSGHGERPVEQEKKLPDTVEEAEVEITQAYHRAIQEVRYIREVAERNYHVDPKASDGSTSADVASQDD